MGLIDLIKEKLGFDDEEDDELDFGIGTGAWEEDEDEDEDAGRLADKLRRMPVRRADINILDYRERELFIRDRCEQMRAASDDMAGQRQEYEKVTQQLDEICALSLTKFSELKRLAKRIEKIQEDEKKYERPLSKITESQYRDMERREKDIPEAIKKMQ